MLAIKNKPSSFKDSTDSFNLVKDEFLSTENTYEILKKRIQDKAVSTAILITPSKKYKEDLISKIKFNALADKWEDDTVAYSSVTKMINHPSYLEIIKMGERVLPLILNRMKKTPDHYFVALSKITGESPAPKGCEFNEAVSAWISWGEEKGYI
jgi:hypothetical protein